MATEAVHPILISFKHIIQIKTLVELSTDRSANVHNPCKVYAETYTKIIELTKNNYITGSKLLQLVMFNLILNRIITAFVRNSF